jgi:deoxyguanosine kinase
VLETSLGPEPLLDVLQHVEVELGRKLEERWGPRTLDLDLLLYDRLVLDTPRLVVPHPRMAWRRFVLEPAALVAPAMVHPTTGWTVARLLEHSRQSAFYVAISGSIGAGKSELARQVAEHCGAQLLAEPLDLERLAAFYADPSGKAWAMELEFLEERSRLLAADRPQWSDKTRPTVSDFWFDQSAAFARVWLPPELLPEYLARWEEARRAVVRPRLIVIVEAPPDQLLRRVRHRGRQCERGLDEERLQRIGRAVLDEATRPDQGPLLRLPGDNPEADLAEVLAAIEASGATGVLSEGT